LQEVQAMRARQTWSRSRRRRRGAPRPVWPLIALALAGAAAAVLATRRRGERGERADRADRADRRGDGSAHPGPGEAGNARAGRAARQSSDWRDLDDETPEAEEAVAAAEPAQLWIAGPAGNLYVRDSGEIGGGGRLPVLFVHGLAGNGGQWALQLDHLRRRRRALALDLRGHGESDPADAAGPGGPAGPGKDRPYAIESLAADVAAVADHFALRHFVLAGHSLGAAVGIAYAAAHPERVAGLLLVDPNGDQTRIPRAQIEPFLAALRAEPLRELEAYYRQLVAGADRDAARLVLEDLRLTAEDAVAPAVAAAVEFAPLPALARYGGPRLAVISQANSLPYSLHNLLPDLPVQLLRGTGHWLMMDRPEAFNRVLDGFLDLLEGP
jgi:pimeloyl-ACP methyl ester carboxylesterase